MRGQIPKWDGSSATQQAGNSVVTTNASGIGTITFNRPFPQRPIVVAMGGNGESITTVEPGAAASPTGFSFVAYNQAGSVINGPVRVLWIATLPG